MKIVSKLPDIGTTIFTTMSALAQQTGAINLGQGFPDFPCDPRLLDCLDTATRAGHNQYAPMIGVAQLREAIAAKVSACYGRDYCPDTEITVTAGATQALHTALSAIVHPGDEVIVFEPVYDSYDPVIRLNGGRTVYARLDQPNFAPDFDQLRALITPRTRAIMLNSPHNPSGTIWSGADMQRLADVVAGTDIVLISDEVYEHMVFDGQRHESVSRYPALTERAFVISSFGKTCHVTGWKVGYCLAPRELMAEFRKVHQYTVFTVHTPSQYALASYMQLRNHLELASFYQTKRDLFLAQTQHSRLRWRTPVGSYFALAEYGHLAAFSLMSDRAFAEHLTRQVGVAAIPLSPFYHDATDRKTVRFCFAKQDATLIAAAERLVAL